MIEHPKHDHLIQDEDMLEANKDTKFISATKSPDLDADEKRVYAKYHKGDWKTEAQVLVDGEWYVESRNTLHSIPDNKTEYSTRQKRPVERSHSMFSNLSAFWRIIFAPVYGIVFMYFCLSGKDINLQILRDNEKSD